MSYSVVEVFRTLQGEGFHTGTPAVFLRLAGCNMWNGRDRDRARDADRNYAECPLWCDTDFIPTKTGLSTSEVFDMIEEVADGIKFVVITGGEPLLQLEGELVTMLKDDGFYIAVETNGSVDIYDHDLPGLCYRYDIDWVTCSPKNLPKDVALKWCNELKVVYPGCEPNEYLSRINSEHQFIQSKADTIMSGKSVLNYDNQRRAVEFVSNNQERGWRLSLQTHKVIGLP